MVNLKNVKASMPVPIAKRIADSSRRVISTQILTLIHFIKETCYDLDSLQRYLNIYCGYYNNRHFRASKKKRMVSFDNHKVSDRPGHCKPAKAMDFDAAICLLNDKPEK